MAGRHWGFTLPSLPREWYDFLEQFRAEHDMSQWQVIIMALSALKHRSDQDGASMAITRAVETIKEQYPVKKKAT